MDTNNIIFFNKDLDFIGEVDEYPSLIFIRKWDTYGSFEIHVNEFNKDLFCKGNYIMLNNDGSKTGIIEHIECNDDNDIEDITIKGYSLLYLLLNRITIPPTGSAYNTFNTYAEDILIELVEFNAVNPTDMKRRIEHLTVESSKHRGNQISFQSRYKVLSDELTALCKTSGLGCQIRLDYKNKKFIFEVLEGKDLTSSQIDNPPAIFSQEYDNINDQTYTDSNVGYKNVGYVAGQGEGENREVIIVNDNLSGLDRRETFIDARDIEDDSTSVSLEDRGKIKLAETPEVKNFEFNVESEGYKTEWNLGDLVTIISKKYSTKLDTRVLEVQETYENGIVKIEPSFGESMQSISDKVNSISNNLNGEHNSANSNGGGDKSYMHTQISSQSTWTIKHNLSKYPSIVMTDSGGNQVMGDVKYIDLNTIEVSFSGAFAGIAYLN